MKAIFLDRDGTLNVDETGYTYKTEEYQLHEQVIEGLQKLKEFSLFITTNQSGIKRGYYTEQQMHKFNEVLVQDLKKNDITIKKVYFCSDLGESKDTCRKPSPKMVLQAQEEFDIDLKSSFVIGDRAKDVEMAKNAGCGAILLLTGFGKEEIDEAKEKGVSFVAKDMMQAATFINANNDKIFQRDELITRVQELKEQKKSIVTLNGTFDILHKGHEKILKEAKAQGDILVVALNADSSVKKNKGPKRPVNNEQARAKMMASFDFVDIVTIFDEQTPIPLLEKIKPNIHVNGSEYGKECIERETVEKHGGKIYIVQLEPGYSTTNILKK